ncbi:MAG: TonB-dependent receptor [Muribaculaceae bacterium]|nr:TonB-dependent receptor [Muribaculaceae bacterium]
MTKIKLTSKREKGQSLLKKSFMTLVALLLAIPAFAQTVNLSGQVTDESGEPLIGATVMIQNTNNGTATDFDGNYSIPNAPAMGTIVVSYVGYTTQRIPINGQFTINVVMKDDTQSLDELVVVGYGTMKKNDVTGSVGTVGTEKLNAKGAASVLENLQGTVPGVNITKSSGRTNGGIDVEIRGKSSINSSTKPMYVVDGVITDDIDFLNPRDIERIDVLKDASSTAIYGSRATAGVVIVTTKGALGVKNEQAPTISYDGYYGWTKAAHLPNFMTPQEFYNYRIMMCGTPVNSFAGITPTFSPQTTFGYFRFGTGGIDWALLKSIDSDPNSPNILQERLANGESYFWPDYILQTGVQQNHYVSVSGGSKSTTYNFGIGVNDEKGLYQGDKSTTYSFKGSMDVRINKVISAGFNLNAAVIDNGYADDNAISKAWVMNPFMRPYNDEGELNMYPGNKSTLGTNEYQFSDQVSPLMLRLNSTKSRKTYRVLGNVYLKLDLLKGLTFKSTFAPSYSAYREGSFSGYENPQTPGKTYGGAEVSTSTATVNNNSGYSWIWDNMLTYNRTFGEDHSLNVMGLISAEKSESEKYQMVSDAVLANTDWWNMGSGTINGEKCTSSYSKTTMMSYALRANYGFKNKYLITATMRWDGSSKLATGHEWRSFPSVALAWVLTEESFMEKIRNTLNNLKLRLSYGITGNNKGVTAYQTMVGLNAPVYYPFYGTPYSSGFAANGIVDKNLSWEISHEINVGLDFGLFRNRITGTVDWYMKNSDKLLYSVELPLEAGGDKMMTNIGKVKNTGVEISLNTINVETRDWSWQTTFTFAHNVNTVKQINGVADEINTSGATGGLFVGYPINNVYTYQWDGIVSDRNMTVPDNEVAVNHGFVPGSTVRECDYYYACYDLYEGCPIVRDVNGDGQIDTNDRILMNGEPKWTGSLTSNLSYKLPKKGGMLDFSFTIYSRQGGKTFSPFMATDLFKIGDRGWQKIMVDYYLPAGTLISADGMNFDGTLINPVYQTETHYGSWPHFNAGTNSGAGSQASPKDYWSLSKQVVDASFVKVKNISLGYTFDRDILKHIGCKEARIYVNITNPFVFTKYMGFDPEWANAAAKNDGPSTISYQIGASIKF